MKQKIAIIGAGKVAHSLVPALVKSGYNVEAIQSKNLLSAKKLAQKYSVKHFTDSLKEIPAGIKIFLLSVPDSEIKKTAEKLHNIINNTENTLKYFESISKCFVPKCLVKIGESKEPKKRRSMVDSAPKRIEFECNFLKFYIDFTIVVSEGDSPTNIKGSIIYGTSRTLCFSECIFPKESNNCEKCQRLLRCDRLEDKPLIHFSVTRHGMIQSSGELEGEWWIEDKSNLLELHYRVLDLIWKQALDWANEIILP